MSSCSSAKRFLIASSASTSLISALSFATIAGGVFGGALSAFQVREMMPGTPSSAKVGMSGMTSMRFSVAASRMRALPAWCSG